MPDWSYHPVFRPLLFGLPAAAARDLTLGAIGALTELPLGPQLIDFMGHMRAPASLQQSAWGISFPSPVGLAAGLDTGATAFKALARFGFGFLEAGPVTLAPQPGAGTIGRLDAQQAIRYPTLAANRGADALASQLQRIGRLPVPLGIRLAHRPGASHEQAAHERSQLALQLSRWADFFTLDARSALEGGWSTQQWQYHIMSIQKALANTAMPRPVLLCLPADYDLAHGEWLLSASVSCGIAGVVVADDLASDMEHRVVGPIARTPSLVLVRAIHSRWGDRLPIIASGGVHSPADAIELLAAGATFVQIHSGLVFSGPGLPKRINEAIAAWRPAQAVDQPSFQLRKITSWPAWVWFALLGAGMLIGGILAWLVAITRVVLPYDEQFVGMTRAQLALVSQRLLPFMAHDRVTLAGTMISIGVLYGQLALYGMRRGAHWARQAIIVSAANGFASFFLFLGFGYFDPLHALVAVLLFVLFALGLRGPQFAQAPDAAPNLHNDWRWLAGLWGQLLFVGIGFGLMLAGCVIAGVGISSVFVPEDLAFMGISRSSLSAATPRLIALIAHDRAGFGGALVSDGLALLLASLWGFRQGARWLWWAFVAAGLPGFVAAFGIHLSVGYTNLWHLAPAMLALVFYLLGLSLAYPYLCHPAAAARRQASELFGSRSAEHTIKAA